MVHENGGGGVYISRPFFISPTFFLNIYHVAFLDGPSNEMRPDRTLYIFT